MSFYREYPGIIEKIDPSVKEFVDKILRVVELTDELFIKQLQTNPVYSDEAKEHLKKHKSYKTNPLTVLRIKKNKPVETPYHEYYKDIIPQVISILENAIKDLNKVKLRELPRNWWRNYLKTVIKGFQTDSWQSVEAAFLSTPQDSRFLLSIGPIERYHDKLLGTKRFFTAWFLDKNEEQAKINQRLWRELTKIGKESNLNTFIPTLYIGDIICEGGEVAKLNATGWSRPENPEILDKFGSIKIIACNKYLKKMGKQNIEIRMWSNKWNVSQSLKDDLKKIQDDYPLLSLIMHEFGHTFQKPKNAALNLGQHYTFIEEARAEINMLYLCSKLEEKGLVKPQTTRQLLMTKLLLFNFVYQDFKLNKQREEYLYATTMMHLQGLKAGLMSLDKHRVVFSAIDENNLYSAIEAMRNNLSDITNSYSETKNLNRYKKTIAEKTNWLAETILF